MNTTIKNQLYSVFQASLIIIVLKSKNVFSKEHLAGKRLCKNTNENMCVILCRDWNLDLKPDDVGLRDILKGKNFKTCTLILENCSYTNYTSNPWEGIQTNKVPKIKNLKILHSLIDLNKLNLKFFNHLRNLTVKNTTMTGLQSKTLYQLPYLWKLSIKQNKFLKWVEKGLLQNLSLEFIHIQGVNLNQKATALFFKNLTNDSNIPSVRHVDWSHNNFGNFSKAFLTHFPNLNTLILTNSSIFSFENEIFSNTTIKSLYIDKNKIRRLPEKIFRPLIETASFISLEGNPLSCDCELEWLQVLMKTHKTEHITVKCATLKGINFLEADICPEGKSKGGKNPPAIFCTSKESSKITDNYNLRLNTIKSWPTLNVISRQFSIVNDKPEFIQVNLANDTDIENSFLWYGNYANATSPQFICQKLLQQQFTVKVIPNVNYLICLAKGYKYFKIDIFDCLPIKTKALYDNQPWLTKKSISPTIISIFITFLFALAMGAIILYLTIRKNPSLIRGSKRVIEVKRHDKAQILIMPRGYEGRDQNDGSSMALMRPQLPLEPSRSYDTISTVSYVSAHQPTQLEILAYRFSRLRELFQRNNNIPSPSTSIPMQITTPINRRLPPNVDLLLEYEWYTITTTTTTKE